MNSQINALHFKLSSFLIDLMIFVLIYLGITALFELPIFLSGALLISYWLACASIFYAQLKLFKVTLGMKIRSLLSPDKSLFSGITVVVLLLICSLVIFVMPKISPQFRAASNWEINLFIPQSPNDNPDWTTLSFYYLIGAWPKNFAGLPIFYTMPYQKGPPQHFIPEITARWSMPQIRVTIEGPKTPSPKLTANQVKSCLSKTYGCMIYREKLLDAHLQEMKKLQPKSITLKWFEVGSNSINETERPRGVYLKAENKTLTQERFILITEKGSQQTLILDRPSGDDGKHAEELFLKTIGSIRLSDDLLIGKSWAYQQLQDIHLKKLQTTEDSFKLFSDFAKIQSVLISKISVDPAGLQAYYHLGGISLLMAKHAAEVRTRKTQVLRGPLLQVVDEVLAVTKPLVRNSHLYAKDINPTHEQTQKLESLWFEIKKLN